jgi:hypothetical protein
MKLFTARHLSLLLLLSLFGGNVQADRAYEDGSCCAREYVCSCNPLNCGSFGLEVEGGIYPIVWTKRDSTLLVSCPTTATTNPVGSFGKLPKFSDLYKLPWTVGGRIHYAMSDNTEIYVEFNYAQARHKDSCQSLSCGSTSNDCCAVGLVTITPAAPLALSLGKYKLFSAYFGARYYWDRWCDRVSFFLGEKVGLVHHKRVSFNSLSAVAGGFDCFGFGTGFCGSANNCGSNSCNDFFRRNTVVSGGVNFGFDVCFCGNWGLTLTGEVVASCGPRGNGNIVLGVDDAANLGGSNIIVGHVNTELSFPVTFGVRYNF